MNKSQQAFGRNARLVKQALEQAGQPLSAYQLLDRLRPDGLRAPVQIYRALDQLAAAGAVHRLERLNSWMACHDKQGHDHHAVLLICQHCQSVEEASAELIDAALSKLCAGLSFGLRSSSVEIAGICSSCDGGVT